MRIHAVLGVTLVALALAGCSGDAPAPVETPTLTTPQASLAGEWVVTRTVTESDDPTTAERAVGSQSVRYVLIEQSTCDSVVCPGTVSSGATLEARETTELTQVDGGLGYTFTGALNCLREDASTVLALDAFTFTQTAALAVVDVDDSGAASSLDGTITYTDSLTADAQRAGCKRDPATVNVVYSVTAVRAETVAPTED